VGFMLGFLAVHITQQPGSTVSPVMPLLILGLPIADTVWVMTRRMIKGEGPFSPDRTHVHHRFLNLGFEHRFTVLIIYGVCTFWAVFAVLGRNLPDYVLFYSFVLLSTGGYLVLSALKRKPGLLPDFFKDANDGLRDSLTYQRISDVVDLGVPLVQAILAVYALLTFYHLLHHNTVAWQIIGLLLLIGVALKLWGEKNGTFILLVVYAVGGIAAYEVWNADSHYIAGRSVREIGDLLIGMAALLSFLKFMLRKPGEFFLGTPDFLVLVVCVTLAVASHTAAFSYPVNSPLFRFVLLLFSMRTMLTRRGRTQLVVSNAVIGFLVLMLTIQVLR